MSSVNKVILVGNLGADPEVKDIGDGVKVARLSMATSEKYKNREGITQEKTEWHRVVLWRGLAEIAERYVKKGHKLYIEGKLQTRSYEQDGTTKYTTEVIGNQMVMLSAANSGSGDYSTNENSYNTSSTSSSGTTSAKREASPVPEEFSESNAGGGDDADDLPF